MCVCVCVCVCVTSQVVLVIKNLPANARDADPRAGEIPWRRARQPAAVFLPGESPWAEEPGGLQSMGLQSQT